MVELRKREEDVWKALKEISDPEIPVLSIVDLRIVRNVDVTGDTVTVLLTPTFTGCPALDAIAEAVEHAVLAMGFKTAKVEKSYVAEWSTDLLDQSTRDKMEQFGIAPPAYTGNGSIQQGVPCPFCGSVETHIDSPFGPTVCRQIYYCNDCRQSFERFKTV